FQKLDQDLFFIFLLIATFLVKTAIFCYFSYQNPPKSDFRAKYDIFYPKIKNITILCKIKKLAKKKTQNPLTFFHFFDPNHKK
ncbi:hypothetical protein ACPWUF_10285, partial [Bisgaard Taxon 46]